MSWVLRGVRSKDVEALTAAPSAGVSQNGSWGKGEQRAPPPGSSWSLHPSQLDPAAWTPWEALKCGGAEMPLQGCDLW